MLRADSHCLDSRILAGTPSFHPLGRPLWSPVKLDGPTHSLVGAGFKPALHPLPSFPRIACPHEDGGANPSLISNGPLHSRRGGSGTALPRITPHPPPFPPLPHPDISSSPVPPPSTAFLPLRKIPLPCYHPPMKDSFPAPDLVPTPSGIPPHMSFRTERSGVE